VVWFNFISGTHYPTSFCGRHQVWGSGAHSNAPTARTTHTFRRGDLPASLQHKDGGRMRQARILNDPKNPVLTDKRKALMHRVMDGVTDLSGVMFILHNYKFCDNILQWLISHGYTGKKLVELTVKQFNGNVPSLVNFVVTAANDTGGISNDRVEDT